VQLHIDAQSHVCNRELMVYFYLQLHIDVHVDIYLSLFLKGEVDIYLQLKPMSFFT
jgi:hypothetical protein